MKYATTNPYADPEKAARRLLEIANTVEPVQDGRIHIKKINGPLLMEGASPAEYRAGLELAIARGWLWSWLWRCSAPNPEPVVRAVAYFRFGPSSTTGNGSSCGLPGNFCCPSNF
jgi:hypothetical protein